MAVHDLSYAPWTGTPLPRRAAVAAIVRMELLRPFRSLWVRLVVISAFMITGGWLMLLFFAACSCSAFTKSCGSFTANGTSPSARSRSRCGSAASPSTTARRRT